MIFEKAIRRRQKTDPIQGHVEVDSRELSGQPLLTLNPKQVMPSYIISPQDWPLQFELLVKWTPQAINQRHVSAQEIVEDEPQKDCDFYDYESVDKPDLAYVSRYCEVQFYSLGQMRIPQEDRVLLVKGVTHQGWTVDIPEDGVIYRQLFGCQTDGLLKQLRRNLGHGKWLITAPKTGLEKENMVPLLFYGACVPLKAPLDRVQQVYASLSTTGQQTIVKLYQEDRLRELGIKVPQGGRYKDWDYEFIEADENQTDLAQMLHTGQIKVNVIRGEERHTYQSVSYQNLPQNNNLVYILFERRSA